MSTQIIMDEKSKRTIGIICFLPAIAFFSCLVYYLITLGPIIEAQRMQDHTAVVTYTAHNYTTLFVMLASSALISAAVLMYCLVHLAKQKNVNAPTKAMWILGLAALVPISFILFWYLHVRREPKYMDVYPDFA